MTRRVSCVSPSSPVHPHSKSVDSLPFDARDTVCLWWLRSTQPPPPTSSFIKFSLLTNDDILSSQNSSEILFPFSYSYGKEGYLTYIQLTLFSMRVHLSLSCVWVYKIRSEKTSRFMCLDDWEGRRSFGALVLGVTGVLVVNGELSVIRKPRPVTNPNGG